MSFKRVFILFSHQCFNHTSLLIHENKVHSLCIAQYFNQTIASSHAIVHFDEIVFQITLISLMDTLSHSNRNFTNSLNF